MGLCVLKVGQQGLVITSVIFNTLSLGHKLFKTVLKSPCSRLLESVFQTAGCSCCLSWFLPFFPGRRFSDGDCGAGGAPRRPAPLLGRCGPAAPSRESPPCAWRARFGCSQL